MVTTSVGFDESAFNELEYARTVARHLHVEQHEHIVHPDIVDLLPKLAWHFDEPFADSSAVPTYYVSKAARERVTVALSGDGGDEVWAGYARHRVERAELDARRWLGPIGPTAGRLATMLPLSIKGARSLRRLALSPADACAQKHTYGQFEPERGADCIRRTSQRRCRTPIPSPGSAGPTRRVSLAIRSTARSTST